MYCEGAIVEFVSGRNDCDSDGLRKGFGLIYCRKAGWRTPPMRREARMTATAMKRPRPANKMRGREEKDRRGVGREIATVGSYDSLALMYVLHMGQRV